MSNGDDVLDNWEEIDDTRLNNQIHQIRREIDISTVVPLPNGLQRMVIPPDDFYGNSYTQPPKPAVTILRRPTQQSNDAKSSEVKPKAPIKTLQQREQEYAKARLRILGSAKNPEDELESAISQVMVNSVRSPSSSEIIDPNSDRTAAPTISDKLLQPSTNLNNHQIRNSEGIIRMPRGPDGTSGFTFRR
ncbi:unnamed protein product [Hermetia illucens]|uniref:SUZ RNA-binding domain-containing n=1 Tax=Hermetia illucens TaxID=343691 RepID=A0A7R8USY1_HERIL|nr:SUZ domain-containing protein 1 isoform X2 [Hermetia illucens]CAD7086035.1 unnamed protein product [Hermetia illucens]